MSASIMIVPYIFVISMIVIWGGAIIYLFILIVRCLKKYLNSGVPKESADVIKSLGETIKAHRTRCKMTQEFVAEALGVSRQAVSKWESGKTDPSTSNLLALSKLFGISAGELLRGTGHKEE